MKKTKICPHCGEREVKAYEAFYRCEVCHNDFGREALSDDGLPMVEAVKGIRFRYGDIISGSVRLRFLQDGEDCLYEIYDSNGGGLDKFAGLLESKEWIQFKKKLFQELFLMDWHREYLPVNDGKEIRGNNEWELAIMVNEKEEIVYGGVDAYPIYWDSFLKILDPFFDKLKQ